MSRKPDFCPYIYSDGVKLYLEFDKMVLDFVFTEAGLHKALKHIPNIARQPGFVSGNGNLATKLISLQPARKVVRKTKASVYLEKVPEALRKGADDIAKLIPKKGG